MSAKSSVDKSSVTISSLDNFAVGPAAAGPGTALTSEPVVRERANFSLSRLARALICGLKRPRLRRPVISLLVVIAVWELVGRFVVTNHLFFVPFSAVCRALAQLAATGELQRDVAASLAAIAYGMGLACLAGVAFGILLGASRTASDYSEFFLNALYATPLIALAPLLILWFGIGLMSKVAVVFLISIFPILISTASGVRNVDLYFLDVARAFGASRPQIVAKVLIPAALPFVLTGIRLAIGRAIAGVVVGEMFGARAGLGYLIYTSSQTFDVPSLFAGVLCLAVIGVSLTSLLQGLEGRLVRWKPPVLED